jgi:hypothetical protein
MTESQEPLLPSKAIRRFDVFAEFNRQERLEKGDEADAAKGYGIWIAKVVASRKFGSRPESPHEKARHAAEREEQKFRSVGDDEQTDEVFDLEIIERMGKKFYDDVFAPAIEEARNEGKKYEDIRDDIRAEWKPARRRR